MVEKKDDKILDSIDLISENEFAIFEALFYRDLEKYCDIVSIACCDKCVESYIDYWPIALDRGDSYFQRNSMDIGYFYENSRLSDIYSLEVFKHLLKKIECPNCESPLETSFYSDNLPFNASYEQVKSINEIGKIAKETPFMVLGHDYAKKVLEQILSIADNTTVKKLDQKFYRARNYSNLLPSVNDFHHPPKNKVGEGRYNHSGMPVLYLGDSPETTYYEMREPIEGVYLADMSISANLKILDLNEKLDIDGNILQPLLWSSLMSSRAEGEGLFKPHYCFTRFVADCAKRAGFDGIFYPSVRNGDARNLVLLKPESVINQIQVSNIRLYMKQRLF